MAEPDILLYGVATTPYTEKVRCALRWKGLDYRLVEPTSPEDYRRWSPDTGLLPVLELEGRRIPDSMAILDALEAHVPHPPLESPDPRLSREQRRLEQWVGETFTFYLVRWLQSRARALGLEPRDPDAPPLARLGLIGEDGRLRPEAYDTRDGGPGAEFERRLDDLVSMLGQRVHFHGEVLSRGDLAVYGMLVPLARNRYPRARELLVARPTLLRFVERVEAQVGASEDADA